MDGAVGLLEFVEDGAAASEDVSLDGDGGVGIFVASAFGLTQWSPLHIPDAGGEAGAGAVQVEGDRHGGAESPVGGRGFDEGSDLGGDGGQGTLCPVVDGDDGRGVGRGSGGWDGGGGWCGRAAGRIGDDVDRMGGASGSGEETR